MILNDDVYTYSQEIRNTIYSTCSNCDTLVTPIGKTHVCLLHYKYLVKINFWTFLLNFSHPIYLRQLSDIVFHNV